jgi:hypothetical protein
MKILFVHGTGVRQPAFDATFEAVRMNMARFLPTAFVAPCYWGHLGSDLGKGLSVPLYDQSKSVVAAEKENDAPERWALLYDDPLIELRLLASRSAAKPVLTFTATPVSILRDSLAALGQKIDAEAWPDVQLSRRASALSAFEAVSSFTGLDAAINAGVTLEPAQGLDTLRLIVARALTSGWILEQMDAGFPAVPANERDRMVVAAFEMLGGSRTQTKGLVGDFLKILAKPLTALLSAVVVDPLWHAAASGGRAYRRSIAQSATPGVGDILLYQARGEKIRAFIAQTIEDESKSTGEPMVLLAHSLGGIACIDLLVASAQPNIRGVITVGSQAPFLYEIGALTQLELPSKLPSHVPPWLNIYDQDDLLSFKALPIMEGGSGITDREVRSYQPFPAAHGAYWNNVLVWEEIKSFLEAV